MDLKEDLNWDSDNIKGKDCTDEYHDNWNRIHDINSPLKTNLDNCLEIHFKMSRVTIQGSKPARYLATLGLKQL